MEASVENLSAREKELTTKIKELEDGFKSNKAELAEATALRQKQMKEFHGTAWWFNPMNRLKNIEK